MVSVGTIVFLSQELMFFAGLFAMYFTSRANGQAGDWAEQTANLNVVYGFIITTILVASSFTAQFGVFAAERGDVLVSDAGSGSPWHWQWPSSVSWPSSTTR